MKKNDWLNLGRDEFVQINGSIIAEDSLSKAYAAIYCPLTSESRKLLAKYTNGDATTLYSFGFYKGDLRICEIEENFLVTLTIPENVKEIVRILRNRGIDLDKYEVPCTDNEKKVIIEQLENKKKYSMDFILKHAEMIKDKEFLIKKRRWFFSK